MTSYLVYWKTFWKEFGGPEQAMNFVTHRGYGSGAKLFLKVKPGDTVWVIGKNSPSETDKWLLFQRIIVRRTYFDRSTKRQRSVADKVESQFFELNHQKNLEPHLRRIRFDPTKQITFRGRKLGQQIQSPRKLSNSDEKLFVRLSTKLSQITPTGVPNQKSKISSLIDQSDVTPVAIDIAEPSTPERVQTQAYRILRDTKLARHVKP